MTGQIALQHIATYNPRLLNAEELRRYFLARQDLLDSLLDGIRLEGDNPPQHYLIIGQRGMGKTTLLCRLAQAIEDDTKLHASWMPLLFPEEQWNVARLSDFWLNCADALGDALEREGKEAEAASLDAEVGRIVAVEGEDRLARAAQELLLVWARKLKRRFVLLVDNLDRVLEALKEPDQWALRSVLQTESALLLLGASSAPLETAFRYNKPFYDLFKIHDLKRLSLDEVKEVLLRLAESLHAPTVAKLVNRDPGRIKVFYDFTGGNPRNIVLLFAALAQGPESDLRAQLERMLDQCTPLYKARIDELPFQQQQIVDALMLAWHPATAATIAKATRMDVNAVSGQLARLVDIGLVEKVVLPGKKRTGFMVAERFFNIWYLMRRATRRSRLRPLWLAEFLKGFYGNDELLQLAESFLSGSGDGSPEANRRRGEFGFLLAMALDDSAIRRAVEHRAASELLAIREQIGDLMGDLQECEHYAVTMDDVRRRLREVADKDWPADINRSEFERLFLGALATTARVKQGMAEAICSNPQEWIPRIWELARSEAEKFIGKKIPQKDLKVLRDAIANGLLHHIGDLDGLRALAHKSGIKGLEKRVRNLIGTNNISDLEHWCVCGSVLEQGDKFEAEQCFREALKIDSLSADALIGLGEVLAEHKDRYKEALGYLKQATKLHPEAAAGWAALGDIKRTINPSSQEGKKEFLRAFEIDPNNRKARIRLSLFALKESNADRVFELMETMAAQGDLLAIHMLTMSAIGDDVRLKKTWGYWEVCDIGNKAGYALSAAIAATSTRDWHKIESLLGQAIEKSEVSLFENKDLSGYFMLFVMQTSRMDLLPDLIRFLESEGLDEQWLPLYEALKAYVEKSDEALQGVAPEVRGAAQSIFDFMARVEKIGKKVQQPVAAGNRAKAPKRRARKAS